LRQIIKNNNLNEFSLDLEGDDLCRHDKISFIQLFINQIEKVFIFNCSLLDKKEIKSVLKPILESDKCLKFMFDCRSDSDALAHQYDIHLKGVVDVQLFEIGYRKCKGFGGRFYFGLYKTLNEYKSEVNISNSYLAIKDKYSKKNLKMKTLKLI
jgi:hypothetical protein